MPMTSRIVGAPTNVKPIRPEAISNAQSRFASDAEIRATVTKFAPRYSECPPAVKPALDDALDQLGIPKDSFDHIRLLVEAAAGKEGQFKLFAYPGIDAKPVQIESIGNGTDQRTVMREFAIKIHSLIAAGLNIIIKPALYKLDLPEHSAGKLEDVAWSLGFFCDLDADHGFDVANRAAVLPCRPTLEIETSPGNIQPWYIFPEAVEPDVAAPLIKAFVYAVGAGVESATMEHGGRLGGTYNFPNKAKIERGRSPEPYRAHLIEPEIDVTNLADTPQPVEFERLKSDLLEKYPKAFEAPAKAEQKQSEFDWDTAEPHAARRNLPDAEVIGVLNDPQFSQGKRSNGCMKLAHRMRLAKHTPNEIVKTWQRFPNSICIGHFTDEAHMRRELRAWWFNQEPIQSIADKFAGALDKMQQSAPLNFTKVTELVRDDLAFPDVNDKGVPKPTPANARVFLQLVGVNCSYDEFTDQLLVGGKLLGGWVGEMSDEIELRLCHWCKKVFNFEPEPFKMKNAVMQLCYENKFNSIVDWLDEIEPKWDGKPRIDTWLIDHFGAADTELTRTIGRIVLLAAVRRARHPGCKFDEFLILESPQGWNKSSALRVLAGGDVYFTDQTLLSADERRQAEHIKGKWIVELAELQGANKADREKQKAFASRQSDKVRHVYKHFETSQPRQCIIIGTTNEQEYLLDITGGRRWWPIKVTGIVDLDYLKAEREQLFAEAAHIEAQDQSPGLIRLPQHLWSVAAVEQEARRVKDPWEDALADIKGTAYPVAGMPDWHEQRIHAAMVFANVRIELDQRNMNNGKRLRGIMSRFGWERHDNIKIDGKQGAGYSRKINEPMPVQAPLSEQAPADSEWAKLFKV